MPTVPEQEGTRQLGAPFGSLEDVIPEPYLTGVGCTTQRGPRDTTTVAVKRFGGGFARFACAAVEADSIKSALARYRAAGAAALGGASAQSGDPGNEGGEGGLVYLYTTYTCELTHWWQWDRFVGGYYYLWTTGECQFVEHYWDPSSGGSGPAAPPATDTTRWTPLDSLANSEPDSLTVEGLNLHEAARCVLHPGECGKYIASANDARTWALARMSATGAPSTHNNIIDAERHAYWSARLVREFGDSATARIWTDLHEATSDRPGEVCMDKFNNAIGRSIGVLLGPTATDATLKSAVLARRSELQASPAC